MAMKRCPKCDRIFEEDSLKFCRSDGTVLVSRPLNEQTTNFLPVVTAVRARVYAKLGRTRIAGAMLDKINKDAEVKWVAPYLVATVYFALDEMDRGFEWLEKAFDECDENLNYMTVDPVLDPSRGDPRFMDLLSRAGLNQSRAKTHFVVPVFADCRSSGRLAS